MTLRGARYIHVLVTCPLGWGSASRDTIRIARLACETGLFPVFEAAAGDVVSVTKIRHRLPVQDYLRPQRRFAHLFEPEERTDGIARIQSRADRNIQRFGFASASIRQRLRACVKDGLTQGSPRPSRPSKGPNIRPQQSTNVLSTTISNTRRRLKRMYRT